MKPKSEVDADVVLTIHTDLKGLMDLSQLVGALINSSGLQSDHAEALQPLVDVLLPYCSNFGFVSYTSHDGEPIKFAKPRG